MQAGDVFDGAPVAAVEGVGALQEEARRHRLAGALGDHQHAGVAGLAGVVGEEGAAEVGRGAVLGVGAGVAGVEEGPVVGPDLCAAQDAEGDSGLRHLAPLLADLLALGVGEAGEEVVEAGIACVVPVELHAVAEFQPGRLQPAGFLVGGEEQVEGRGAGVAHHLQHPGEQ